MELHNVQFESFEVCVQNYRTTKKTQTIFFWVILLMEEILHQLIGSLSHYLQGFHTCQVVLDFFHQQYHPLFCSNGWKLLNCAKCEDPIEWWQLSNAKKTVCLGYIEDYAAQFYGNYSKPSRFEPSRMTQWKVGAHRFFFFVPWLIN